MANAKIYKCFPHIFCASYYRFRDIKISNCLPSKSRSRSQIAIFSITPFNDKCHSLKMSHLHFYTSSNHFRDIKILNFRLPKSRSRSQSTIFAFDTCGFWHFPPNGTIAKIALHDHDLLFEGQNPKMLMSESVRASANMHGTIFKHLDICQRMIPLRKLYLMSFIYFFNDNNLKF